MISTEKVGKRIAMLRKEKELSQEQLAEQVNVTSQAVSKWETGKSLPDTATLPLLAKVLGHTIDSLLLPQELFVLKAIYTDGHENHDITQYVNQFIVGNRLILHLSEQTVPVTISNDRMKVLLLKYETPSGVYYTYVPTGSSANLNLCSTGYSSVQDNLDIVYAVYGNHSKHLDVLRKIKHYKFFQWQQFTINHELFPSLINNEGPDYLLLVYVNSIGIHAVSGLEGEQVHYSSDRSQLSVSSQRNQSYIIEHVPNLHFGHGMDCSWAGALYTSLRTMGIQTTYEEVMGVSGACWRIAFAPVWDYSSVDGLVAYDHVRPAFKAYGYKPIWADRISREERDLEKLNIVDSIREHQLPIAINLRVAPEWGVITGYLDHGNRLLCRSYFDEETFEDLKDDTDFQIEMNATKGYLYVDNWPFAMVRFGDPTDPPSDHENLLTSLKIKVETMNIFESRGYKMGYEALKTWREGLLDKAWYQTADHESFTRRLGVNHFCMMALFDARRSAAVYLKASERLLHGNKGSELLEEMTTLYEQMHKQIEEIYIKLPSPKSTKDADIYKIWTHQHRESQADLLQSLVSLEHKSDELAKQILSIYNP
ncbi:transcriptional repressor DicA [compost metagenome]